LRFRQSQRDGEHISLLIFGGSQGARAINEAMIGALPGLGLQKELLHVTHQTAKLISKGARWLRSRGWRERVDVRPYIDDMVSEFGNAD